MPIKKTLDQCLENAKRLFDLNGYVCEKVPGHEGGRNLVYICVRAGEPKFVLRLSGLGDKAAEDYLAEAEFVHYLADAGAPVADVIASVNGRLVESFSQDGKDYYVVLFTYAKGMLISDNGYRYRDGVPLEEYF